ncbi:unnamed protein product [Closterium sp. NIES-64]|nr:unnamed protein product [Closterium sp. NIES-64]
MALPLGKLGDLVLKTLSKPLAKAIKRRAASHPKFRASIANWAQVRARAGAPRVGGTHKGYHRFTVRLQRRLYGQAPAGHIKRLNEEKAVSTASEVVGELIVLADWVERGEEKAVNTASEVVGELIVFVVRKGGVGREGAAWVGWKGGGTVNEWVERIVAGGVVFIEAARSARSNARKEAKLKQEREALHEGDRQLEEEARRLRERVEQLEEALAADVWLPRVLTGLATGSTSASSSSSASNSSSSGSSSGSSVPTPPAAVGGTREGEAEGRGVESREGGESEGYGVEEEQGEGSGAGGSRREGGEGPGEGQEKGGRAGVGGRVRRWMGGWMGGWGGGSKHAPGAAAGDGVVRINDMEGGDGTGEEGGGGEEEGAVELKMSASR